MTRLEPDPRLVESAKVILWCIVAACVIGACAVSFADDELDDRGPDSQPCPFSSQREIGVCDEWMTWDEPLPGTTSYWVVERKRAGMGGLLQKYAPVDLLHWDGRPGPITWHFDRIVHQRGRLYLYRVRACNSNGCSALTRNRIRYRAP